MATFSTHYYEQVGIDVHNVPLDEVKRLGDIGTIRFLDNYPHKGKRLRMVEIRFGSILINVFASIHELEEMTDEPECAD